MPRQAVISEVMEVGHKGRGRHWTLAEVDARKRAEEELDRAEPVDLKPPEWLGKEALVLWYWAIDQAKGVKLFDNLDTQTLAIYCCAVVECRRLACMKRLTAERVKQYQAWVRIITQLGDKLGFTPSARARLIKKRAEDHPDEFGKMFD